MIKEDFLTLLKPFEQALNDYEQVGTITDTETLKKVVNIWDEFKNIPDVSRVIYSRVKVAPKTDFGCASCVSEAIRSTVQWRKELRKEIPKYDYKGIREKKAKVNVIEPKDVKKLGINNIEDARKYLDLSGIKYHHKAKLPSLLKLING